jgi:hypothetical protein
MHTAFFERRTTTVDYSALSATRLSFSLPGCGTALKTHFKAQSAAPPRSCIE